MVFLTTLLVALLAHAAPPPQGSAPASLDETEFQLGLVTLDTLRATCDGGDPAACHRLGRRYEWGLGGATVSAPEAAAGYRKGCAGGVTIDCGLAANALLHQSDASAAPLAQQGCDAGDVVACYVLGHLQLIGLGVPAAPLPGRVRIQAACDAGVGSACAILGQIYAGAVPSLAPDYAKARPLLETACAASDANACGWLGTLLLQGNGGAVDAARGVSILEKGCGGGNGIACESLGAVYLQGIGVPVDAARGVPYMRKACDAKMASSCAQLATMTLQGQGGISPDRAEALGYLRSACTYGLPAACEELDNACKSGATDACR